MLDFYFFNNAVLNLILILSVLTLLLQTICAVTLTPKHCLKSKLCKFYEVLLIIHLATLSLLVCIVIQQMLFEYTCDNTLYIWRWCSGITIFVASLAVDAVNKKITAIPAGIAALLTLPVLESLPNHDYCYLYLAAMVFYLLRAIYYIYFEMQSRRTIIDEHSIKEALDVLHSAILFSDISGQIILINTKMSVLIEKLTGKQWRNVNDLRTALLNYKDSPKATRKQDSQKSILIFELADGSSWQFKSELIQCCKKTYIQISATDVTQLTKAKAALKQRQNELAQRQTELNELLSNLAVIQKEKELLHIRSQVHDLMSQKVSVLQRVLKNGTPETYYNLASSLAGIFEDSISQHKFIQNQNWSELTALFQSIGVKINLSGQLPPQDYQKELCLAVVQEAASNAVRHALAQNVNVECKENSASYVLEITNDGTPPSPTITPGGGIKGMKRRAAEQQASLKITTEPNFCIKLTLPKEMSAHD